MSKDRSLVTAYFDYCASSEIRTRLFDGPPLTMEEVTRDTETQDALWHACLDAGWTMEELDAAYLERFKDDPRVPRIIEERRKERNRK
jgi:hypothetical protein